MELPDEEKTGGFGREAVSCRRLLAARITKSIGGDTRIRFCDCSKDSGESAAMPVFCRWTTQQELFELIADESHACPMARQHACCAICCIARGHADTGSTIQRTIIASIRNARRLSLPNCIAETPSLTCQNATFEEDCAVIDITTVRQFYISESSLNEFARSQPVGNRRFAPTSRSQGSCPMAVRRDMK